MIIFPMEKKDKILEIFNNNIFHNFFLSEDGLTIELKREDDTRDSQIFEELNKLTNALICLDIDFSVDENGYILFDK